MQSGKSGKSGQSGQSGQSKVKFQICHHSLMMLLLKEVKYVAEQHKSSIDGTMKDKEMNEVAETEDTT